MHVLLYICFYVYSNYFYLTSNLCSFSTAHKTTVVFICFDLSDFGGHLWVLVFVSDLLPLFFATVPDWLLIMCIVVRKNYLPYIKPSI